MRVCFSAIPAYGHVFPLVPLATAAAAAGHEVSFVAGAEFDGRLPVRVLPGVPEGMTLQDVKEQLGHSTIVLTSNTYGHLLDERRSEMARELEAVLGG